MNRRSLLKTPLLYAAALRAKEVAGPTFETHYGKVQGATVQGVHMFKGIPYGGATEGPARFLPPSKPAKWSGVRDCTQTGPRCVQGPGNIFLNPVIGEYFRGSKDRAELAPQPDSENCLVLNVLTTGARGSRPVMVYIHGGGYTGGSTHLTVYSDSFVREQDVVLVGINHRLNVFGYLYLGGLNDKYAIGNPGQLDLIAALEWVRDNIRNFGGDPKNVTIFGESGGGAKISTLLAMPAAKGLFHRAIVESGSSLRVAKPDDATAAAKSLLAKLNVDANQLHTVPAADLFKAASGARLGPVIDGRSIPEQTWEPKAPAGAAGIPMIIGCCKDESTLFATNDQAAFSLDEAGLRQRVLKAGVPEAAADKLIAAYHRGYPQATPSDIYFRFSTDRGARWNAVKQAELKLEQSKAPVYMYYFAWNTPFADGKYRAFHTAELPLAMRLVRHPESEQLSKQISGAWAGFARNGNPGWAAYSTGERATMIFDTKSQVVKDPDAEQRLILRDRPSGNLL